MYKKFGQQVGRRMMPVVWNVRNPMRRDPTRTTMLRNKFVSEVNRRFKALRQAVYQLVVVEDAFGENPAPSPMFGDAPVKNAKRWEFLTNDQKLAEFNKWLKGQVDQKIVSLSGADIWSSKYIDSAYRKGLVRAFVDSHQKDLIKDPDFYTKSQKNFLRDSFAQPEALSKVKMLASRTYEDLKGVTAQMATQMNRTLADGLIHGRGVIAVAKDLASRIDISAGRARTIARTEIVAAHAQGQLDAYSDLGVAEVGVMAEWSTAGDDVVCPECDELEGVIMTIDEAQGMIPRHPNCRCTWIPALDTKPEKGQVRGAKEIGAAISASAKAETGEKTATGAREASDWVGVDVEVMPDRSPTG